MLNWLTISKENTWRVGRRRRKVFESHWQKRLGRPNFKINPKWLRDETALGESEREMPSNKILRVERQRKREKLSGLLYTGRDLALQNGGCVPLYAALHVPTAHTQKATLVPLTATFQRHLQSNQDFVYFSSWSVGILYLIWNIDVGLLFYAISWHYIHIDLRNKWKKRWIHFLPKEVSVDMSQNVWSALDNFCSYSHRILWLAVHIGCLLTHRKRGTKPQELEKVSLKLVCSGKIWKSTNITFGCYLKRLT